MKALKGFFIILITLMMVGYQSDKDELINLQQKITDMSNEISELKEINGSLEKENDDLRNKNDILRKSITSLDHSVASYSNGIINFVKSNKVGDAHYGTTIYSMTLIGYNTSLYDEPLEVLDYSDGKSPTAKFNVFGTLYNFRIVNVEWNEDFSDYSIKKEIVRLDEVTNKSVVFYSLFSKGLNTDLLLWENQDGDSFHLTISEDGYGFSKSILICDEYSN